MDSKLTAPPQQTPPSVAVETHPKQLKAWLDALPLANAHEAARKLADALAATNAAPVAEDTRAKLLQHYAESIALLLPALQQEYVGRPLPLSDKQKHSAALARELLTHLAHGHKRILLDVVQRRIGFGSTKLAPPAIYHAIEALGAVLDVAYESYAPTPAGVWAELHQLYWYAARERFSAQPLPAPAAGSIDAAYKRILLLALADPYRLLQGQLPLVQAYLRRFGDAAQLHALGQAETPHGLFLIRLDSDKPPRPLTQEASDADARSDILLNAIPVARALHEQLQALDRGVAPKSLDLPEDAGTAPYRELLRRLLRQWSVTPKRMFSRSARAVQAYLCVGISTLHHALASAAPRPEPDAATAAPITLELAEPGTAAGAHPTYNCATWQVVNESAGGVALAQDPGAASRVKVGEIVGLRSGEASWGIGVVRWARSEADGHLALGAQRLAPRAEPIAIRPVIGPADAVFQPALLLPAVPALEQPERIVAARGSFQPLREFDVQLHGEARRLRAARLIEQSDSFDLFEFNL